MITLDDCLAFCETPPAVVEEIAKQQNLPLMLACACAQGGSDGTSDPGNVEAPAPNLT
ncbi:MAG TPA: hypothetical protein VJ673_08905 [Aromatoleum sp.]|uniref:hypothetical protein n=1 Tax=Aromatoleum sp. TaxID=2307007 RepID=UPI002B464C1F|nr:hypothetical protein [Aromatoleum sp.]HJV25795.1 hypothetical protein [Aromatoleum sp.]